MLPDTVTSTGQSVLIVEDEFAVANDLRGILERAGYIVTGTAASVAKALGLLEQQRPDLVLLDIRLKGPQTGIALAQQLNTAHIPFVYLSANTNTSTLEEVKATQPYGFIVKPFREKDVLVALEIAQHRHAHSVEVRIRQEQALQIALTDALSQEGNWEERLLQVTRIFQSYLPFDYLAFGLASEQGLNVIHSCRFLRIGPDEYQTIKTSSFLQMTGMTLEKYNQLRTTIPYEGEGPFLYVGDDFVAICRQNGLKQAVAKTFRQQSNLMLPLRTSQNGDCMISFYSRQPDAFTTVHLNLLRRLQSSLTLSIDRLIALDKLERLSQQLSQENNYLQEEVKTVANYEEIIGQSPLLLSVFKSIGQVAPTDYSVLILGESGTGKELIARAVHNQSLRKGKALIKLNCAALPPQLIESELFGHEKGSFTGATQQRIGKFELAHGGTIFLDEIGELPLELQPKLLRVLQEKEIERVGGKGPIPCDVRIIAATNRNLQQEVAAGRFRSDLFFRLNVFPVNLPPLRTARTTCCRWPLTSWKRLPRSWVKT
jgi:transcriptional regulator with GAF, ATPase, and Fis domain